jgi:dihydrofolate synthase / folylpolyglutamate synthase
MRELLAALGEPQRGYPTVHVVGTNGKTSTTLMTAALLSAAGLRTGAYISPHVRAWSERIQVDGEDADLGAALARVRPHSGGATQFEVLTAAGFAEFAARPVDAAVVEAGLGGRHDATNVLEAPVVVLTNVSLEHTEVLGDTREQIAAEKLAVVAPGSHVVLGEPEWEAQARAAGAATVELVSGSNLALAVAAAAALLGDRVDPSAAEAVIVPGRLERRSERPLEIWDGAHNLAGILYLLARIPSREYILVGSILADKDAGEMLRALTALGRTFIATESRNPRAIPANDLAELAKPHFAHVETVADPEAALRRARELAGRDGAVLVTGSLYLLAALSLDG